MPEASGLAVLADAAVDVDFEQVTTRVLAWQKSAEAAETRAAAADAKWRTAEACVLRLRAEIDAAYAIARTWQASVKDAETRAAAATNALRAADVEVSRLRVEVEDARACVQTLRKTIEDAQNLATTAAAKYHALELRHATLAERVGALEAEKEDLTRRLAAAAVTAPHPSVASPVQQQIEQMLASQRAIQQHMEALARGSASPDAQAAPPAQASSAPLSATSPQSGNAWRYEFPVWCHGIQATYRVGLQGTSHSDRVLLDGTLYTRGAFVDECMVRAGSTPPRKRMRADNFILFQKGRGHHKRLVRLKGNALLRARDGEPQTEPREVMDTRVGDRARRGKGGKRDDDEEDTDGDKEDTDGDEEDDS